MSAWPTYPIFELGKVTTGPSTSEEDLYGGDIPFVTPAELDRTDPVIAASRTLSPLGSAKARTLPRDTVMVCCIGSLGKVGISGRTVATNQQINSVVFDETRVWPRYGFYACRLLKPRLEMMAPATTVAIVNKSKFEKLEIPVPPLAAQRRIAEILDCGPSAEPPSPNSTPSHSPSTSTNLATPPPIRKVGQYGHWATWVRNSATEHRTSLAPSENLLCGFPMWSAAQST
jgi:hypothetical protein